MSVKTHPKPAAMTEPSQAFRLIRSRKTVSFASAFRSVFTDSALWYLLAGLLLIFAIGISLLAKLT